MSLHDGDFGNARGRREAFENRDAIERRARIEAASASAVRDRLEKGSPSSARRNFAGMLNELVRDAAGRELPGLAALAEIRKGQKYGYKSRFGFDERYDPPQAAGTVRDAAGRLIGDGRAKRTGETDINDGSDHWADGRVSAIEAEFLLDAARALIEAVRSRRYAQGRV